MNALSEVQAAVSTKAAAEKRADAARLELHAAMLRHLVPGTPVRWWSSDRHSPYEISGVVQAPREGMCVGRNNAVFVVRENCDDGWWVDVADLSYVGDKED